MAKVRGLIFLNVQHQEVPFGIPHYIQCIRHAKDVNLVVEQDGFYFANHPYFSLWLL